MEPIKQEEEEEESSRPTEEEKLQAMKSLEELNTKLQVKKEFKEKNLTASANRPKEDDLRKLDGSIKKNTAFTKKLREMTESKRDSLTAEFKNLNLTKYIQEAATNIAEAKLKLADVSCAVHVCSLIHCRYDSFSSLLLDQLQRIYGQKTKKDEDKSAVSAKYRLGLRLLGELVISGIIDEGVGTAILHDMLSNIVAIDSRDTKDYFYVGVVVGFARHYAEDVAGIFPRKHHILWGKYELKPPRVQLLKPEKQNLFRELLIDYYRSASKYLANQHKEMHKRARKDVQILQSKGELSPEREEENEKARKNYEKLVTNLTTLADVLDQDMIDLPEDQSIHETSNISIDLQLPSLSTKEEFDATSLWEDEDQRSFYEDLTDIRPFIPAILLEGVKRSHTDSESSDTPSTGAADTKTDIVADSKDDETSEEKVLEEVIKETENMSLEDDDDEEDMPLEEDEVIPAGNETGEVTKLDELLVRLPNLMNKKFVDEFAVEFCLINSKFNRQKLVKALFNVDKNRMDLVPFYSRLVSTLNCCLPDIGPLLVDMLTREFRFQLRKKEQVFVHTKTKNARFIAELTKFNIFPKPETMRCITKALQDFSHHNIDLACIMIEHCGRYLLRSPESHLRAKALLEIMYRKKQIQHLDGRHKAMVEDALYAANPPDVKATSIISRPPLQAYIHKLLYKDLNKLNIEKILKQFRKLPWNDPEVFQWAVEAISQIWLIKFSNIHCVANLLAGLKTYQDEPIIWLVDAVLEDIRYGLELNLPQMNQRRVAIMKFLGELYNYQLVESNVIFRTLYTLLTFGYDRYGNAGLLDQFDSYFRARLVCVLLDTCGAYFDHGSTRKKLDAFFIVFQCYLLKKRQPLPVEVEYMVTDTILSLRPSMVLYESVEEGMEALGELERRFKSKLGADYEEVDGGDDSDEEEMERVEHNQEEEEENDEEDDDDIEQNDSLSETDGFFDEEQTVLKSGPEHIPCPEDDDFISALDKVMSENRKMDTTAAARVPTVDVAIPMNLKRSGDDHKPVELVEEKEGQFKKFTLITKKGHKQHLKELNIPVESVLASSLEDTQQALKVEKEEMKRIVLNHKRRQEEEDNTQDPATKSSILPVQQDIIKRTQLQHHPAWQQSYHHHGNRPKPHPSQKKPGDWQKK